MWPFREWTCALALLTAWLPGLDLSALGQGGWSPYPPASQPSADHAQHLAWFSDQPMGYPAAAPSPEEGIWYDTNPPGRQPIYETLPTEEQWIAPPVERRYFDDPVYGGPQDGMPESEPGYPRPEMWHWQVLPDGLIYRSYQASTHESRTSVVLFGERDGRSLWDATVGGRAGLLRYGNASRLFPQGWQLDVEGAALTRLSLDDQRDMETADYRAGAPLTYGVDNWQFKFAYYHLSSHLADEHAIRNPGSLASRINYVRDALVVGASYYPDPCWRLYSEIGYALNADGGAEPWELQFGAEFSRPGPTGLHGTPFFAVNAHLREEHNFGGDIALQTGWLWRGKSGQVSRAGLHYFNGKSSQYRTFNDSEQQIGVGLWYDF